LWLGWSREDLFTTFVNGPEFLILCNRAGIDRGWHPTPPGLGSRVFATRLYRTALGRPPSTAEVQHWATALDSGTITGAAAAYAFLFGPEMTALRLPDAEFIERLYEAVMGRPSDPAGKAGWIGWLERGLPREDAFAGFIVSPEFAQICAEYGIQRGTYTPPPGGMARIFAATLISRIMERDWRAAELDRWHNAIMTGRTSGAALAYELLFSDERFDKGDFSNRNNITFVNILYKGLLGRTPDAATINNHLRQMDNGVSRYSVFLSVVNTNEFNQICIDHGVTRGTAPDASNFIPGLFTSKENRIWNFIRGANFDGVSNRPEHIAGIIGNLYRERSGPNSGSWIPCPFQELGTGVNAGIGIMQWSPLARRTALENYMWRNGINEQTFITEMNRCSVGDAQCSIYNHAHNITIYNRVLEVQVNYIIHEMRTSERHYMDHINAPSNRTGRAGASSYSELFCALFVRPGAGIGPNNEIRDPGVRQALRGTQFYQNRYSYDGLAMKRNMAESTYANFALFHR